MESFHIFVCGTAIANAPLALNRVDSMGLGTRFEHGENVYATIEDLVMSMLTGSISQLDMFTSILILDQAFKNEGDVGESLEELIEVQDILNQHNLTKVKLYLITKNTDLYNQIKRGYSGREVLIYQNTEVFLTDEFNIAYIGSIMGGNRDGGGLQPKREVTQTQIERIEQERQNIIEDSKQVEQETLDYEKNVPQSQIDRDEYLGSAQHNARMSERKKEQERQAREAQRLGITYFVNEWDELVFLDKHKMVIDDFDEYAEKLKQEQREQSRGNRQQGSGGNQGSSEDTIRQEADELGFEYEDDIHKPLYEDLEDDFHEGYQDEYQEEVPQPRPRPRPNNTRGQLSTSYPKGSTSSANLDTDKTNYKPFEERVQVGDRDTGSQERSENLAMVKVLFEDLMNDGMNITEEKLSEDSVVMAVSSVRGAGGSGLVAQIAEVYAMLGRTVNIIDLDVNGRGQSSYFSNFDERVSERKGIANALINVAEGGVINKASVSVTSRIDICGISQNVGIMEEGYKKTIARNLNSVLIDAKDFYDIVLIDIPIEDFELYMGTPFSNVERYLFVTENKEYEVERLFRQYLAGFVESRGMLSSEVFENATIVLNKYDNRNRDRQGYLINREWLKEKLYAKGSPYDAMLVGGEIPYKTRYEEQFLTNQRYIWQDSGYMATVKIMLKESV